MLEWLDCPIITLVDLVCLIIMLFCSFVMKKFIGYDRRCMYLNKNDINKKAVKQKDYVFMDKNKLVETTKEYFIL